MLRSKYERIRTYILIGSFFVVAPLIIILFNGNVNLDLRSNASVDPLCDYYALADFDDTDSVGISDFNLWLNKYREYKEDNSSYLRGYDLDNDKKIGLTDFSLWLNRWREFKSCRSDSGNCHAGCFVEGSVCGDSVCEDEENKVNCPTDCITCGDGICEGDETVSNCEDDCKIVTEASYTVKVASISYYPIDSQDSDKLDYEVVNNSWGEYSMSVNELKNKVVRLTNDLEESLEEGSRYKGYSNSEAPKSLDYVVQMEEKYDEPVPTDYSKEYSENIFMTDYNAIMNRLNICDLVDNQGIKEVWIWSYTGIDRAGWESNFSSKYGDISNSDRDNTDLPICNGSYTVYEFNYGREIEEAVHTTFHQLEAIFRFLDADLFNNNFVGEVGTNMGEVKRCGNCHFPPNGTKDYDYSNRSVYVDSDFLDWQAEGIGTTTNFNCELWDCDELKYYIMWRQTIPGLNNGLTYKGQSMPNWWGFIADFDKKMSQLKEEIDTLPLVASWKLENLQIQDYSGNNFNGNAIGTVNSINGKVGKGVEIGSDQSRIEISEGSKLLLNNAGSFLKPQSFTIMAYVKRPNSACNYNYCSIFSKGSSRFQGYSMAIYNNKVALRINDDASNAVIGSTVLNPDTWYHLVATYDANTGKLRAYVNGNLDGTSTKVGPINYKDAKVVIGNGNGNFDLPLMGQIDEVKFFNKALSAQEIQSYF